MSLHSSKLCSLIILEHFGEIVQKVSNELKWGPKNLSLLVFTTDLHISEVKKALAVLIQYGFVTFEPGKLAKIAEYKLHPEKVLLLLRYPKYLALVEKKFSVEARLLVEDLLKYGEDCASNTILRVSKQMKQEMLGEVSNSMRLVSLRDTVNTLITEQYLTRCPGVLPDAVPADGRAALHVPVFATDGNELFILPPINLKALARLDEGGILEAGVDPCDRQVYWRVNYDRFHQDLRDELMVAAMTRRFDANAGQLMLHVLRLMYLRTNAWAPISNPVPTAELREDIAKRGGDNAYLSQYVEQYLKIIEEDSSHFLTKSDGNNSTVTVNLATAVRQLTCNAVDNVIEQRFGQKAARIFRLVRTKKFVELEQIQQSGMIPDKEAKQTTYRLLQENLLQMQELRKPIVTTAGPNKTFFLFHIDIGQVVQVVMDTCHKALVNALTRRGHELAENRRLIEKQDRITTVAQSMREQGTDEGHISQLVDEWLTPPEQDLLKSIDTMLSRLQLAEVQIDETLFLLQLFAFYQCNDKIKRR